MSSMKRLRAPLVVMFGMIMATMAFAGPANAADTVYPPSAPPVRVLGTSLSADVPTQVAGVSQSAGAAQSAGAGELAFTGANALGVGALGGLLLVGGVILVSSSRRRKSNI